MLWLASWTPANRSRLLRCGCSHEELCSPFGSRLTVDIEHKAVTNTGSEAQCGQIDRQCNTQRRAGAQASGSSCLEASVDRHGLFANERWSTVFVDEVELPLMTDVGAVPRDGDMDGERQRLRFGPNDRQPSSEHEEFAVARLGGVAQQHVYSEARGCNEIFHNSTLGASATHPADHTPDWRSVTEPDYDATDAEDAVETDETLTPPESTLAVILAAGAGERFNAPEHKLESKLKKKPLIWWAATHALAAGFAEVLVIEGSIPVSALVPDQVSIVHNHDWADGQSRSVQVAVHYADMAGYESIVVGLADQPFVPPEAWRLVAASTSPIAVAKFGKLATPPVRLHSDVWGLLPLDGDEGARQLLRSRPELVAEVPCPGSAVDVDTVVEFDQVRRNHLTRELGSWT